MRPEFFKTNICPEFRGFVPESRNFVFSIFILNTFTKFNPKQFGITKFAILLTKVNYKDQHKKCTCNYFML